MSKPRRVLFLVENLPSPFDRRVWQEATTLRDAGYGVSIICPTGKGYEKTHEILDGIEILRYRIPEADGVAGYLLEYSAALAFTFVRTFKVKFDIVHACNPPDLFFLIGGFWKLFGKKFVFDHHDANPELFEAKFGRRGLLWKAMVWLERLTFRTADISIATNESYKRIAVGRGGMPSDKVFVVRSGPSLERMKIFPAVQSLKKQKKFLVGYVGVMGRQEGIDYLLRAAAHIVHDLGRKDVHFGLVGGGTSLEEMKRLAGELGLDGYVTFTGRVPDEQMLAVLNTADVCVNPDVANEMNDISTMNKVMEYMALGKPIVQFDLAEGRFSAQEASLYARRNNALDLASKILELVDDEKKRKTMGDFGRRRVIEELEWRHEVPKLLAAYESLVPKDQARKARSVKSSAHPSGA
ncbi:MAG TPA: glycosyltransferase family 4 protein [Burkholderiales bacterium]